MNHKRINIFTGHYGSGKTEISINFALFLKKYYNKVVIVDLDIVNPYFRTKDVAKQLERQGVQVIAPAFANTNVDIPVLPAEVISVFQDKESMAVFDVGGDDVGATVLGTYNRYLNKEPYDMFFVINPKRPLTKSEQDVIQLLKDIENSSRLKVTKLINNTNLQNITTVEDVINGQNIIENISKEINIPISYIVGTDKIIAQLPTNLRAKAFEIKRYLELPWEDN